MSEPKVTRENEHLEWLNDRLKEEYDRHSRHYYAIKNALIEHGPEVSRECIEYLTKIEKRTQGIIEWLEEPWDDPNAVIDEMTIRLKRLLQDTRGRR